MATASSSALTKPVSTTKSVLLTILVIGLFLSGGLALSHEVLWTRRFVDLLGATGQATSRVLGCFFLSLSLGAALAALLAPKLKHPLRWAACAEAAVGLLALPILTLPEWSESLWQQLGLAGLTSWRGDGLKFLLSVGLIFPPATAMGFVLPLVIAHVARSYHSSSRTVILLYTANLVGGLGGLLLVSLVLIPALGAGLSLQVVLGGNLLIGCLLGLAARSPARDAAPVQTIPEIATLRRSEFLLPLFLVFASGFIILALEVLALRSLMLVAPLSYHTPSILLAIVLGCLAFATGYSAKLVRKHRLLDVLNVIIPWAGLAIATAPFFLMMAARFLPLDAASRLEVHLGNVALFALASYGLPLIVSGLLFPLATALLPENQLSAGVWGWLLAANGVGGWLGAEFAALVLLPITGLYISLGILGGMTTLVGFVVARERFRRLPHRNPLAASCTALLASLLMIAPLSMFPVVNPNLPFKVLDQQVDREGTVAVIEHTSFGRALLISNQYILGNTKSYADERRQMALPLAIHPNPRNVAAIGIATGITPGAALQFPQVQRLTAMELSPSVVSLAQKYFHQENLNLMDDPRVQVLVEDGRTLILAAPGQFDVVVGDLILPWSPGEGRLYTVEHFRAVRRSLRTGGLYCQWIPAYQLTPEQFLAITRTFCEVFPHAELVRREFRLTSPAVALIGWEDDRVIDWSVVEGRCQRIRQENTIADPSIRHSQVIAMLSLGSATAFRSSGPINTLQNTFVELDASVERVTGHPASKYLMGGKWLHFLDSHQAFPASRASEADALRQAGLDWSMAEFDLLKTGSLPSVLPDNLKIPAGLRDDDQINWDEWPGDPRLILQALDQR